MSDDKSVAVENATIARHFKPGNPQTTALKMLNEAIHAYHEGKKQSAQAPPLEMKYVLRTLRRAAANPTLAAKLKKKVKRLDNDTIKVLGLDKGNTPTAEAIRERIAVLECYRGRIFPRFC